MSKLTQQLRHAWNTFIDNTDNKRTDSYGGSYGGSYGLRPDRVRLTRTNERSIISSLTTRIGIDFAAISIRHVRLDDNERYLETIQSGLNQCLTVEANIDQGGRAFKQDLAMSLLDKGAIAVVPVDTSVSPLGNGSVDIRTLRIAEVISWFPQHVRVSVYNDKTGEREELMLPKRSVAIVESPLYAVMNEPNSTLQRLIKKLNYLDVIDEATSSGKLDLIIQLPYVIKNETRKQQAASRAQDIENQLKGSKYGIAYTDGAEKITQLNRPAENNMLAQVEYLTNMLYSQLGVTESVFDGTADEAAMLNYYNRTIEPILGAVAEALDRSFITKTARSQGHSIAYFKDPFKLVAVSALAEIADKFTRNEILTSNEVRGIIGFKPAKDPKAEELRNKNLPMVDEGEETEPKQIPEVKQVKDQKKLPPKELT